MTVCFKFAEPVNRSVVELDPDRGYIETSNFDATITYRMNTGVGPDVVLGIDDQLFAADDIEELISFLETVRDRLRGIS